MKPDRWVQSSGASHQQRTCFSCLFSRRIFTSRFKSLLFTNRRRISVISLVLRDKNSRTSADWSLTSCWFYWFYWAHDTLTVIKTFKFSFSNSLKLTDWKRKQIMWRSLGILLIINWSDGSSLVCSLMKIKFKIRGKLEKKKNYFVFQIFFFCPIILWPFRWIQRPLVGSQPEGWEPLRLSEAKISWPTAVRSCDRQVPQL